MFAEYDSHSASLSSFNCFGICSGKQDWIVLCTGKTLIRSGVCFRHKTAQTEEVTLKKDRAYRSVGHKVSVFDWSRIRLQDGEKSGQ